MSDTSDIVIYDYTNPLLPEDKSQAILKKCPLCHKNSEILLNAEDLTSWDTGSLIQQAFPYLTTDNREMIKTGIHPECWQEIFGSEDQDEGSDLL